jgi:hypothetical protein
VAAPLLLPLSGVRAVALAAAGQAAAGRQVLLVVAMRLVMRAGWASAAPAGAAGQLESPAWHCHQQVRAMASMLLLLLPLSVVADQQTRMRVG